MKKTKKASKKTKVAKKKVAKKAVKKTAKKIVKKVAAKKTTLKPEQYFYLVDGTALKSVAQLKSALKTMDDSVFYTHVNDYKSDFAAWIFDVFQNKTLAHKVGKIKSKEELIKTL